MSHTNRELALAFNFFHTRRAAWAKAYRHLSADTDLMRLDIAERMLRVYRFSRQPQP